MNSSSARHFSTRAILRDVFGFEELRPGQERAIDAVLAGRDTLTVMPTGSGKSLCFQVPALVLGGLTIVVSPLVALMQDQVAALRLAGVAAETINSSRDRGVNVDAWRSVLAGETRLLYLSPERLMTEPMLAALGRLDVRLIAIDEAHCISQWGPAFRPEYEALSRLRTKFSRVPIMALTATADETTRADIVSRLFGAAVEEIVLGFDRPNIKLSVAAKKDWKKQLLEFVAARPGRSGIVYCLSRKRTEEAAALLAVRGIRALAYHAGMTKEVRESNQNAFMTEPHMVMAATIAFGMGIDKSDVCFVFHADVPASLESYYQEVGRAGRDGSPAEAHMLFGLGDIRMRRLFIEQEVSSAERKRREHQRLAALIGYCESPGCRRRVLLAYFGEASEACGNCDACLDPIAPVDGTKEARLILDVVQSTGERYGAGHIVDVLRGQESAKIAASGHRRLRSFASGAGRKKDYWRSMIRQLIAGGYLNHDIAGFGGLNLTVEGHALLRGERGFPFRPGSSTRAPRKERAGSVSDTVTSEQSALLNALKNLRLKIAAERHIPAYLIFSDRTLAEMARQQPSNLHEFAMINGVGGAKLRDFGELFLNAVAAHRDSISANEIAAR
jgi:ATP-dependent DNA helicase RecQ